MGCAKKCKQLIKPRQPPASIPCTQNAVKIHVTIDLIAEERDSKALKRINTCFDSFLVALRQAAGAAEEVLPSRRLREPFLPVCGFHMARRLDKGHSHTLRSCTFF